MTRFLCVVAIACLLTVNASVSGNAQTGRRHGTPFAVCGDPTATCGTGDYFKPHDLRFRIPARTVIYETEFFYAIILKSIRAKADYGEDCDVFVPESERLEAQKLFPHNKVFASRCTDAGTLYYTNVTPGTRFMAVYAGRTRAEADRMLAQVRATGKFNSANIRRMRAGFNGT